MTTDLERALHEKRATWTTISFRCKDYWIFEEGESATAGHLLFVPCYEKSEYLYACFKAAYQFGFNGIQLEKWDGFNIIQNVGEVAGQTVMYPHVHMIPKYILTKT